MPRPRPRARSAAQLPSIPFTHCYAKTYRKDDKVTAGRTVFNHCQIVGEVAKELLARYPEAFVEQLFPAGAALVAACHDIGKVSPCFYEKLRQNFDVIPAGAITLPVNSALEKSWGGHAGVSQATAVQMGAAQFIPEILGQHHGFSPELGGRDAHCEAFGGEAWQRERERLVAELQRELGESWPAAITAAQARVIAGLTSVADWIGSGFHFEDPAQPWRENIVNAVDDAGFLPLTYRRAASFSEVFGFSPRPEQQAFIDAVTGPGVYILEAPMGMGKTEAALYAAYQMLSSAQATGVYFALPTQLTSNKIYQRFNAFLQKILPEDSAVGAKLLHANAWLVLSEMGEEGRPGGAWFNSAKRGLLAPFGVGTIDQALMAAMHVKHGFVRAFGLAGKVVILDEVHSYDAYTSTLLTALIKLLRQLNCTVIILSATLNRAQRQSLLAQPVSEDAYPLISALPAEDVLREVSLPRADNSEYQLHWQQDDSLALEEALKRAADGQYVLWIENTVATAQSRYLDLAARAAELGVGCGLLHSRYTRADREHNETTWVERFGKAGWPTRHQGGCILVGTQVLEQSLDIDADFLVTRFAPSDMLFQRMGRLWRHAACPRATSAAREVWILAPDLSAAIAEPQKEFGPTASVYSPYVLCRSLEAWQGRQSLCLPADIRPLIDATYDERAESGSMQTWLHQLEEGSPRNKGRKQLSSLATRGLATTGKTLAEAFAQTRYSERDSIDVLLVKAIEPVRLPDDSRASRLVLLDDSEVIIYQQRNKLTHRQWKLLTITLMRQMVAVPLSSAPKDVSRSQLKALFLHQCLDLGDDNWQEDCCPLRVAVQLPSGELKGVDGLAVADNYSIEYCARLGYRALK